MPPPANTFPSDPEKRLRRLEADADELLRRLRNAEQFALSLRQQLDFVGRTGGTSSTPAAPNVILCKTALTGTYPTAANRYYTVQPVKDTSTPAEGAAPTIANNGSTFLAFNVGSAVPALATQVEVSRTSASPDEYTFRYDGG